MSTLTRVIKAALNEISKPESARKGKEFECFTRSQLFTSDDYDMLERTHDYTNNKNDYVDSSKKPDFKFRSRKTGKEFFVEAKYHSEFYKGAVEYKPYQFRRYKAINKEVPVYIVIGVGQRAESPEQVFLIPVRDISIKYDKLSRNFLNKYRIPLDPMHRCRRAIDAIVESG